VSISLSYKLCNKKVLKRRNIWIVMLAQLLSCIFILDFNFFLKLPPAFIELSFLIGSWIVNFLWICAIDWLIPTLLRAFAVFDVTYPSSSLSKSQLQLEIYYYKLKIFDMFHGRRVWNSLRCISFIDQVTIYVFVISLCRFILLIIVFSFQRLFKMKETVIIDNIYMQSLITVACL